MSGFSDRIQPINQLAEQADGFVWRYTETYAAREIGPPWNNPLLFFNMSVWRDVDSLQGFVRSPRHIDIMRSRSQWTLPLPEASMAMWWIDDATRPAVDDAVRAISSIAESGDTQRAFTFNRLFSSTHDSTTSQKPEV